MQKKETTPKHFTNNDKPIRVCIVDCPFSYVGRVKDSQGVNIRICSGIDSDNLNCSLPEITDKPTN